MDSMQIPTNNLRLKSNCFSFMILKLSESSLIDQRGKPAAHRVISS